MSELEDWIAGAAELSDGEIRAAIVKRLDRGKLVQVEAQGAIDTIDGLLEMMLRLHSKARDESERLYKSHSQDDYQDGFQHGYAHGLNRCAAMLERVLFCLQMKGDAASE